MTKHRDSTESGMIKTFRSRGPELLFARKSVALFHPIELAQGIEPVVRRKLAQLNAAEELRDLDVPSENCLAPVTRAGSREYSIRINHAWQLYCVWRDHDAYDVDLVPNYAVGKPRARPGNALLQPIHPGEIPAAGLYETASDWCGRTQLGGRRPADSDYRSP
jgi:plasmid maintenance system killer protein